MKILYWLHTFLPQIGGIQTFSARLIPELRRLGHELVVVSAHGRRPAADYSLFDKSVPVHRFRMVPQLYRQDLRRVLEVRRQIEDVLDEFDPDVIHLHPSGPEILYYLMANQKRALPTLVTIHNNYAHANVSFQPDAGLGKVLRQAGWVTAVSHDSLAWLRASLPELADKSSVIHNGLPPRTGPIPSLPWDPPTLIFVGRLSEQKRVDVLLRAFERVVAHKPHAQLRLVGDGEERAALENLVVELGLTGHVTFVGRVPPERVAAELAAATLCVLSSDYEGLPIAALEAAQWARPIVATAVGGLTELIEDGRSGRLAAPERPEELAEAILDVLADRGRARAMGEAGRRRVDRDFSIQAAAEAYDSLFHRCSAAVRPR